MKYGVYIMIVACILLCCTPRGAQKNVAIEETTVEQLIRYGLNNHINETFDSISNEIYDLIVNNPNDYRYTVSDSVDFQHNQYLIKVTEHQYSNDKNSSVHIDCFEICIQNKDSIVVDGSLVPYSQVKKIFVEYYNAIHNGDFSVVAREDSIYHFGYVDIPQALVHLGVNIKSGRTLDSKEWRIYFQCLISVIEFYEEIRNEISMKEFAKGFDELSAEQKLAIVKYKPMKIVLDFDMSFCSKALLPSDFQYNSR